MKYIIFLCIVSVNIYAEKMLFIPDINITSSKTFQSLIEAPYSVETIEKKKLDIINTDSLQNLSAVVPNSNISGIGSRTYTSISMRGISNYTAIESSASIYVDDVPTPFSYGFGMIELQDVEKIEVLKGAQGTLYGKSSESGIIHFYTPSPTKDFETTLATTIGDYNTRKFYISNSGPINDKLSYMVSLYKNSRDGYSTNTYFNDDFDSRDLQGINMKLDYTPSSDLKISLKYSKNASDDGGTNFKINTKKDPFTLSAPYQDYTQVDTDDASMKIKYTHGDYTFSSVSSYAKEAIIDSGFVDTDGGISLFYDITIEELTQELRLNYTSENYEWLVGAFYSNKFTFDYKDTNTLEALSLYRKWDIELPDENKALFTQMKYWLDDNYALTAGLRYQETNREFNRNFTDFDTSASNADVSSNWSHVLPMLSLSHFTDSNAHLYMSYSKGYRPGGYNYRSPGIDPVPFEPQSTDSFELGYKHNINSKLYMSSVLFYNLIDNLRVVTFGDDLSTTEESADKAEAYGFELDISYSPTEQLYLYTSLGLTMGKYKEFTLGENDYSGNKIIDVPDATFALGAKYKIKQKYFVQSDLRHIGKRYYNVSNTASEDSYNVVNLGLGYEYKGLKAKLYANNIFNNYYVDYMIASPSNNYYHFGAPRTMGINLEKRF